MSTSRSSSTIVGVLAVLVLLAPALAAGDGDLERRTLEVASTLRCPVCQNLSVADSTSDMAREMRGLIVDELRAGKRPEEIRAYFVEKYGEWILLSPTARGFGVLVWLLPVVAAVAGTGVATWALVRWTRRRAPAALTAVDEARRARLRTLATTDVLPADVTAGEARVIEALSELEFDHRAGKLSDADYEDLRALYEARAEEARTSARARAERRVAELEARVAALLREETAPEARRRPRRAWRWIAAAAAVIVFGGVLGVFLAGAVRPRGDGGVTGDLLTGAPSADLRGLLADGQRAMLRQDLGAAAALFRRALAIDPDEPTANAYLGLVLHRTGQPAEALAALERALAHDAISAPALWGKGLVLYEALNRPAEGLHAWETLLTLKLSDVDRKHVTSAVEEARATRGGASRVTPVAGADPRR